MNPLVVIGWVAVVVIAIAAFVYAMHRVERRTKIRRAQRGFGPGTWGAGAAGGVAGGGAYGSAGDAGCSGGG